jgi:molybdate transport system ATP-binding protein
VPLLEARASHRYPAGQAVAVAVASDAAVTALVGPSGCGKSSTLAMIAGLLRPDEGLIRVAGRTLFDSAAGIDLPPEARGAGCVFQDLRLFPHLRVRDNLRYGPRRRGPGPLPLDRVVQALELGEVLDRWPHALAGGQKQRVALGRALLSAPRLLLLDEPLTALDAALKERVLAFLEESLRVLAVPTVYVAHAADEVKRLAGQVVELGTAG